MNGIFIPQEILEDERLNSTEKFVLAYYWYHTRKQNEHCCRKENSDVIEDLKISERTLRRSKKHLKELGLIHFNGGIRVWYVKDKDGQLDRSDGQLDPHNKEIKNKEEIKKNKENKGNKATDESLDDFLSSWEEDALKSKKEHQDNSCSVVDMVTALPTPKEETTSKSEPVKEQYIDKNSIINRMVVKIENMIESIKNCPTYSKTEKERVLKENSYNKVQLEKFFRKYIDEGDYDLKTLDEDNNYLKNITGNAFKSYLSEVNRESREVMSKKNPYGDLEDSNGYRETDRWKK